LALTPALTRLYSPGDLGKLALYVSFAGFATAGVTLGYSMAIVSARNDREASELGAIAAIATFPMAFGSGLVLILLSVESWLGFDQLPYLASVAMVLSLTLTGLFEAMRFWLVRRDRYKVISLATVTQSLLRVGIQVLLGTFGIGLGGLVTGEIVGRGAGLRKMWQESSEQLRGSFRDIDRRRLWETAVNYKKFPLYSAPSSLVNSLALALPIPLIGGTFGVEAAGQYSIASRVLLVPLALMGASVGDVFHSRIAALSRSNSSGAMKLFFSVSCGLLLIGALPMTVISLYGEQIFIAVLGSKWSSAGQIAMVIVPWALMQFAVNPVSRVVVVYRGQEIKLLYDAASLASMVGIFWWSRNSHLSLIEACTVLGRAQAVVYGIYYLLLVSIIRRRADTNLIPDL
jgi:O-antigen/teichoic acid export membrane protein